VSITADARESHEPRPWGPLGAAALAALLFSVWLVFPTGGLAVSIFSAFPVVIQRLRGSTSAVVTIVGSIVLLGGAFSLAHAVVFLLLFALPGLLIGEAMARGHGLRRGCLWAFGLITLEVVAGLLLSGPKMSDLIVGGMASYDSPQYLAWLRNWMAADQAERLVEQAQTFKSALLIVYPAVYVIMGGLLVGANAALVRAYLARRDPAWLDGNEFEGLRLPFGVAIAFVLAGLSVFVPPARPLGYNVLLIVAFLLTLEGLAVVLYYAHRLAGPPFLRKMVVVLVLVNPWAPQLLGLLGLFDLWFDFRRFADVPETPK